MSTKRFQRRSWFGRVIVSNDFEKHCSVIEISDTFSRKSHISRIILEELVLDAASTDNFVVLSTRDDDVILRIDNCQSAHIFNRKECALRLATLNICEIAHYNELEKINTAPVECRLTATTSAVFQVIPNKDGTSTVVRLFQEHDCILSWKLKPVIIQAPEDMRITQAVSGHNHSLFLSDCGKVFALGTGSRGELGTDDIGDSTELVLVEALEHIKIREVAAGGWHSVALSEQGDVYVWGWNHFGQLGLNQDTTEYLPVPLDFDEECVAIDAYNNLTILKMKYGQEVKELRLGSESRGKPSNHINLAK